MAFDFPSSPTNGQQFGNYYWDAATGAWRNLGSKDALAQRLTILEASPAGLVRLSPTSIAVGSGTGSVSPTGLVTFNAASTIAVYGVLNTGYHGYKIIFNTTANTTTGSCVFRFSESGTPTTASLWYGAGFYYGVNGTDSSLTDINPGTDAYCCTVLATGYSNLSTSTEISIQGSRYTAISSSFPNGAGGTNFHALWNASTSLVDGFRIAPPSGTITGTIKVYGLRA